MNAMTADQLSETVRAVCGENVELSKSVEEMILAAYTKGRDDAFDSLGLDPNDFETGDTPVAWCV